MVSNADNRPLADGGSLIILGLVWDEDGCRIRLRIPGEASLLVPAVGLELNYRVPSESRRHCIGHASPRRKNGAYVDCHNRPQPNEKTCVGCAVADAEFASDLHHAHIRERSVLDQAVVEHLEQTNVLYLAAFRDGSIKVGTSTGHRTTKRLAEQGAWRAVEVATVADGFVVRQLEDLVTEKLGLPQSVAIKRKLQGMSSPLSEAMLAERLEPMVDEVHGLLLAVDRLPGSGDLPDDHDPFELSDERWTFPGSDDEVWSGLHLYPARLEAGTHHLEIIEMCGRMAILARPGSDDRFVTDLGRLYGIELDLGRYEPDRLAVQDSLF